MNSSEITDRKKSPKCIMLDLVKRVLKNRIDIKPNKTFIHDVANYTLEKTQVANYIIESIILDKASVDVQEDYKLGKIIGLLAIVNRAIDIISLRK